MQNAFTLVVGICYLLIAYICPFVAVLRGSTINSVTGRSWGMQLVYFTSLCLLLPAIGTWSNSQLGRELAIWAPETPTLVPILLLGWVSPLLAGWIAISFRRLMRLKSEREGFAP